MPAHDHDRRGSHRAADTPDLPTPSPAAQPSPIDGAGALPAGASGDRAAPAMAHWAEGAGDARVVAGSGGAKNESLPPLGYAGPIGPYGPLGTLGPVGNNAWNPSTYISGGASAGWSDWQKRMTAAGGPLSEAGPLGPQGPVGDVDQRGAAVMPELRPGGDAAVLGSLGPLGALGPLGPLGPVGAHGYKADAEGNYRDASGKIVRGVDVPYHDGKRSYPLVENYTEEAAKKKKDNDTSFMVSGSIDKASEVDHYSFTASESEYVTVTLVPEKQLDAFDLTISDGEGKVLFQSKSQQSVDWAQLRVKAGTKLKASVRLKQHNHWLSPSYRLIVTGSTQYVKE